MSIFVDDHSWSQSARADAGHWFRRENPIRRGLAGFNADLCLNLFQDPGATHNVACRSLANHDVVLTHRTESELGIERCNPPRPRPNRYGKIARPLPSLREADTRALPESPGG
jgi:hypothetical protein